MILSQYAMDAIASINYVTKEHENEAISLINKSSKSAPNEQDFHILEVIAGVISISYNAASRSFGPKIIWNDGSRSFAPEDITDNDTSILYDFVQATGSTYLRTKFSHIIWFLNSDQKYGELAVDGYIETFHTNFDTEKWVTCYDFIQYAYHISSAIGIKSECYKRTRAAINQKLLQMNGSDPSFLSLKLLDLILNDAPKEDLLKYEVVINNICERNISPTNQNTNLADSSFSILEKAYKRMKKEDEIKRAKLKYAHYNEIFAKSLAHNNDYFRAVIWLKKACTLYADINKEKLLELRLLLEEWQKHIINEMCTQKYTVNIKPLYDLIERKFDGLSLSESIIQFGMTSKIYKIDELKQKLIENSEQYVFTSMFGSTLLNELGQSVQELPPITAAIDSGDSNTIKKHMVHYVAEQRKLIDVLPIKIAYQFLNNFGPFSEDTLNFLVVDNAIIPENRVEIIKQGIHLGLNGKLYAAMHILQPQTENLIRNLVKLCGDTVTYLNADGTETYKPLSQLFKSEKLKECYDEDILFTFQSIMDDPAGENLRNLNAHGLLEPDVGNGLISLYFLSILISLLSLYSVKALSIRTDLIMREHTDNNDNQDNDG